MIFENYNYQPRKRDELAHLNWIVGPVLTAYDMVGYPFSVVVMGAKSFAVVNYSTREFLTVHPTFKRALRRAAWLAVAVDKANRTL